LLYVEPIYLKAESSPMPELRLVVLASQDRIGYGKSFDEALVNLLGEAAKQLTSTTTTEQPKGTSAAGQAKPGPSPATAPPDVQQLINRAIQEFEDYQRLTSEGKLGEAGQKLEQHKRTLEELKKVVGKK